MTGLASGGVRDYLRRMPRRSVLEYYRDFLADPTHFKRLVKGVIPEDLRDHLVDYSLANLAADTLEIEDLAPLLYLKYRLYGLDDKIRLKHLVIDEAQDFSVLQLFALRRIIRDSSFTILGDLAQGIHSHRGVRDWAEIRRQVFGDCGSEYLTLERSYRTTIEIMSAANKVLTYLEQPDLVKAVPVLRHGESVRIINEPDPAKAAREMKEKIQEATSRGFGTIAVIGKTAPVCLAWQDRLRAAGLDAPVIMGKEEEYRGGAAIVPAYLAKGLEFDVVLLADADQETYRANELDAKLLYVAMTRALHRLHTRSPPSSPGPSRNRVCGASSPARRGQTSPRRRFWRGSGCNGTGKTIAICGGGQPNPDRFSPFRQTPPRDPGRLSRQAPAGGKSGVERGSFRTCATGSPAEYGTIEETISSLALQAIGDWLALHVAR